MTEQTSGRILIVDDEPVNIEVLVDVLEDDYDLLIATDGRSGIALATGERPDLILLDVMMPGLNGYQVCDHLKGQPETADIPIIFITGLGEDRSELRGLAAGAADYITKPINPNVVFRRVANQIELKRARDRQVRLALLDDASGLGSRRAFDRMLYLECRRLRRAPGGSLSLVLIEVDHFVSFNDRYGHPAGDDCLKRVGEVILSSLHRANDIAARYGGESFACILPETPAPGALTLAETIRSAVAGLAIAHAGSTTAPTVTASLGVVTAGAGIEIGSSALVAAAADRMHRATSEGCNRVAGGLYPDEFGDSFLSALPAVQTMGR